MELIRQAIEPDALLAIDKLRAGKAKITTISKNKSGREVVVKWGKESITFHLKNFYGVERACIGYDYFLNQNQKEVIKKQHIVDLYEW